MIAGPNGSGKTTVTVRLRADHWSEGVEYLNPDDVARDRFGDWNNAEAVRQAVLWTQVRREELLKQRAGMAVAPYPNILRNIHAVFSWTVRRWVRTSALT